MWFEMMLKYENNYNCK